MQMVADWADSHVQALLEAEPVTVNPELRVIEVEPHDHSHSHYSHTHDQHSHVQADHNHGGHEHSNGHGSHEHSNGHGGHHEHAHDHNGQRSDKDVVGTASAHRH